MTLWTTLVVIGLAVVVVIVEWIQKAVSRP
jgi:hypothetical protein